MQFLGWVMFERSHLLVFMALKANVFGRDVLAHQLLYYRQ